MKTLLATTAIATMALAGAASAQSVLERVLDQTGAVNDDVTGIFANTADNIGAGATTVYEVDGDSDLGSALGLDEGDSVTYNEGDLDAISGQLTADLVAGITENEDGSFTVSGNVGNSSVPANDFETREAAEAYAAQVVDAFLTTQVTEDLVAGAGSIDGSITNVASQIDEATASIDSEVTAVQSVTANFGNMATTVLGA
ncbi:MAG: hypothetical protein R6V30_00365, partial [Paracoccaceae bacterium]